MRTRLVLAVVVCMTLCGYSVLGSTAAHAGDPQSSGRLLEEIFAPFTAGQKGEPTHRLYAGEQDKKKKKKRKKRARRREEKKEDDLGKVLSLIEGASARLSPMALSDS